ncbi:MAG: hypothetical protein JO235_25030 [Chroococcidiopsidaceae cyanobacterium CP_BM_RX_35]|nr:hypothetical protein [Chroococcidiopsidaceae cyanobacterium CP_BM_RX_35]
MNALRSWQMDCLLFLRVGLICTPAAGGKLTEFLALLLPSVPRLSLVR